MLQREHGAPIFYFGGDQIEPPGCAKLPNAKAININVIATPYSPGLALPDVNQVIPMKINCTKKTPKKASAHRANFVC